LNKNWDSVKLPFIGRNGIIYIAGPQIEAVNPDGTQKWVYSGNLQTYAPIVSNDGTMFIVQGIPGFMADRYNSVWVDVINPDGTYNRKIQVSELDPLEGIIPNGWGTPITDAYGTLYFIERYGGPSGPYKTYMVVIKPGNIKAEFYEIGKELTDSGNSVNPSDMVMANGVVYTVLNNELWAIGAFQNISGKDAVLQISKRDPDAIDENSIYADPIDTATGAHLLERTLLTINGLQELNFKIEYNSLLLNEDLVYYRLNNDSISNSDLPNPVLKGELKNFIHIAIIPYLLSKKLFFNVLKAYIEYNLRVKILRVISLRILNILAKIERKIIYSV
jgi:hypothetical protein